MSTEMTAYHLRTGEKMLLQEIMDTAVTNVEMRDMKMCCEYACCAILADRNVLKIASATLRPAVLNRIKCSGVSYFKGLFKKTCNILSFAEALTWKGVKDGSKRIRVGHPCENGACGRCNN
jgi:hypothetical protein